HYTKVPIWTSQLLHLRELLSPTFLFHWGHHRYIRTDLVSGSDSAPSPYNLLYPAVLYLLLRHTSSIKQRDNVLQYDHPTPGFPNWDNFWLWVAIRPLLDTEPKACPDPVSSYNPNLPVALF